MFYEVVQEDFQKKLVEVRLLDWRECYKSEKEFLALLQEYIDKEVRKFVFDFEMVILVNSCFFGSLVNWYRLINQYGGEIIVYNLDDMMEKSFQVTQMNTFIRVFSQKEEAFAHIFESHK